NLLVLLLLLARQRLQVVRAEELIGRAPAELNIEPVVDPLCFAELFEQRKNVFDERRLRRRLNPVPVVGVVEDVIQSYDRDQIGRVVGRGGYDPGGIDGDLPAIESDL